MHIFSNYLVFSMCNLMLDCSRNDNSFQHYFSRVGLISLNLSSFPFCHTICSFPSKWKVNLYIWLYLSVCLFVWTPAWRKESGYPVIRDIVSLLGHLFKGPSINGIRLFGLFFTLLQSPQWYQQPPWRTSVLSLSSNSTVPVAWIIEPTTESWYIWLHIY